MSKKRQILKTGLTILISVFLVSAFAYATTVGNDVSIGGTLGVTGATTLGGTLTVGTAATGLTFTGGYTTTAIQLGTSGSKMTLAVYDDHVIDINVTSASTDASNSVRPIHMINTMTGVGGVGGRAEFEMNTEVVLGGWANAIKGYTDFGTAGSVTGLGSAVLAEMRLPAKTLTGGNYAPLEIELVVQSGGTTGGTPVSFMYAQASGDSTALADFNATGYLYSLQGLTSGTGNIYYDPTLKIRVGSTTRYLVTSITENKLDLGDSSAGIDIGTAATGLTFTGAYTTTAIQVGTEASDMVLTAGDHAIDVWTTNALTTGTVRSVDITQTHTGATGSIAEALTATLDVEDVALGGWGNAIFGKIDFSTTGSVAGQAGVICAELTMPGGTIGSAGTYATYQAEINLPTSYASGGVPINVFDINVWGAEKAQFDTTGYLFDISGVTSATGKFWNAPTLRMKIGLTGQNTRYLVMSETEGKLDLGDSSDGIDIGTATTGLNFSGAQTNNIVVSTAPTGTDGSIIKAGTSGAHLITTTGNTNFLEFRLENSAATGDNRGIYNRLYLSGTGAGGGESLRSYTDLTGAALGTAHGAHISLGSESASAGTLSGLGAAVRATLSLPNAALTGGTYTALMPEIYSFGSSSDAGAVTELSFIRVVNGGDAAGIATVDDDAFFFVLDGFTAGTGNMTAAGTAMGAVEGTIRVKIDGATKYIPYYPTPGQ